MLDSILLIALKTGWPRREILDLPAAEFNHYMERLTKTPDGNS
jgi:hypothetical protein